MTFPIPSSLLEAVSGQPLPQSQDTLANAMTNTQGRNGSSLVMHGRMWQVGSGSTTTSIPILDSNGLPVLMSASMQAKYTNAVLEIVQAGTVELAVVTAVASNGTLTLDSALSSAPSAGTWFILTPTLQTSLSGSKVIGPTLIDTIPYTAFTANGELDKMYSAILSRNATARMFHISNGLNQPITAEKIIITDSAIINGARNTYDLPSPFTRTDSMANGTAASYGSRYFPELGECGDSAQFGLTMGSVAPISGNVEVYVTEIFG